MLLYTIVILLTVSFGLCACVASRSHSSSIIGRMKFFIFNGVNPKIYIKLLNEINTMIIWFTCMNSENSKKLTLFAKKKCQ